MWFSLFLSPCFLRFDYGVSAVKLRDLLTVVMSEFCFGTAGVWVEGFLRCHYFAMFGLVVLLPPTTLFVLGWGGRCWPLAVAAEL